MIADISAQRLSMLVGSSARQLIFCNFDVAVHSQATAISSSYEATCTVREQHSPLRQLFRRSLNRIGTQINSCFCDISGMMFRKSTEILKAKTANRFLSVRYCAAQIIKLPAVCDRQDDIRWGSLQARHLPRKCRNGPDCWISLSRNQRRQDSSSREEEAIDIAAVDERRLSDPHTTTRVAIVR